LLSYSHDTNKKKNKTNDESLGTEEEICKRDIKKLKGDNLFNKDTTMPKDIKNNTIIPKVDNIP